MQTLEHLSAPSISLDTHFHKISKKVQKQEGITSHFFLHLERIEKN
ncbi:hypothetical protein EVA_16449 [gut metagenome]|uniref:Uncharacterized protein n=1 Tax=gut metagenome TaxID=749906 RepID=J9C6H7_9ZZZZ